MSEIVTIGQRIKKLRKERKLTLQELSNILKKELNIDISKQTLSNIETEKRRPNFEILKALAQIFNVTTDYLLVMTDKKNYPVDDFRFAFSKETEGLSDNDIKEALNFYKLVKSKNNY